jgi:hypothetical protein
MTLPAIRVIRSVSVLLLVSVPMCDVFQGAWPLAPWSLVAFGALTVGLLVAITRWWLGCLRIRSASVQPQFRSLGRLIHGTRSLVLLLFLASWLLRLPDPAAPASSLASALALFGAILSTVGAWIVHEATAHRSRLRSRDDQP